MKGQHDWLAEGAAPDDVDDLTAEEIAQELEARQELILAHETWQLAGCKCQAGHPIEFLDYFDNHCPMCRAADPDDICF